MTPDEFMILYRLAQKVPPEAFIQFAQKGAYLGPGADRVQTMTDVLNARNATQEDKEAMGNLQPYPGPLQAVGMPPAPQPLAASVEPEGNAGFPTVNPAAEDLGLNNAPEGGSQAYLQTLLAAGLPVSATTGIMPGETAGIPDDMWGKWTGLSNDAVKTMQGLMPQAPRPPQYPGFLGSSAHMAQVNMAPIVPPNAAISRRNIPSLAQLLGLIRR